MDEGYWLLIEGVGPGGRLESVWPRGVDSEQLKGFVRAATEGRPPGQHPTILLPSPVLEGLDYMEVDDVRQTALVSRLFLDALTDAGAAEPAYFVATLRPDRTASPAKAQYLWIPREVRGAIDREHSELYVHRGGQKLPTKIVLTAPDEAPLPLVFWIPGSFVFVHDRVRRSLERAGVVGADSAPLDSAYMPWDGLKQKAVQRRVRERPDDADGWFELGRIRAGLHRTTEAVQAFDRALELKPDWNEALYFRGLALQEGGELPEALASLERAIEDGQLQIPWVQYPQLLRQAGRLEEALSAAKQLSERFPNSPIAWQALAATLKEIGRIEEGERAEERARHVRGVPEG